MSFSELAHADQLALLDRLTRDALARHWELNDVVLDVQQFEDNAVWRATSTAGDDYAVRLSVRDGRSARQQRDEMRWLQALAADGAVAVPDPVAALDGRWVVPVDVPGHDEECTLAVLRWLPGTAEPPYAQPGNAEAMGRATAALHANAASVPMEFDRPVWDAATILLEGHALTHPQAHAQLGAGGTAVLQAVADSIVPVLNRGSRGDYGRVHGDLHRENMITLPAGGVGIIDFDDCGTGGFMLDIATVLSSIHRIAQKTPGAYETFARNFLAGYTSVRPLPDEFDRLLEPYLLLRDVWVLNFVTAAAPVNTAVAAWGPRRIAGIMANMRAYTASQRYPGALA